MIGLLLVGLSDEFQSAQGYDTGYHSASAEYRAPSYSGSHAPSYLPVMSQHYLPPHPPRSRVMEACIQSPPIIIAKSYITEMKCDPT